MQAENVDVEQRRRLLGREGFGDAGRGDARIVDQNVDAPGLIEDRRDGLVDGFGVGDVESDHMSAQRSQSVRVLPVLALGVAHGRKHLVAGMDQGLGGLAAKAGGGASNEDGLGHGRFLCAGCG